MRDPEAGDMESDGKASIIFNANNSVEFAGKQDSSRPEEENMVFSDQDCSFPSLADFPFLSSASGPSSSSPSSSSSLSSSSPWPFLLEDPLDSIIDVNGDGMDLWETCIEQPFDSKCEEKVGFLTGESSEDLSTVFLNWLKINKDTITPEDLKSIKLKRSTIESASRRFGGGKQGRVQLLKLILTWVQNHHLKKRRRFCSQETYQDLPNYPPPPLPPQIEITTSNPNVDLHYNSWMPYTDYSHISALATREARKKRMARHRKHPSVPHNKTSSINPRADIPSSSSLEGTAVRRRATSPGERRRVTIFIYFDFICFYLGV